MKKKLSLIIILLLVFIISGCTKTTTTKPEIKEYISSINKTPSGKTYYSLNNTPVTPIGVQIRTDLLLYREQCDFSEIEKRFEMAKSLGVSMVEIPIPWYACEKEEGVYDFRDLGKMLNLASSLDLKIEILLFGTNTTGWSDMVPSYIKNDKEKYPRYISKKDSNGLFLVQNDEDLLDREGKWVEAMMEAIKLWSDTNNKYVVSAIQIHNESDTFPRFVLSQQEIMTVDNSRRLSDIEAWKETLEAYNYLGKIVKNSSYPCITRVNVAQSYKDSWEGFVYDIFNLEGIDIIGDDAYEKTVAFNKALILDFNNEEIFNGNNFPHISENDGSYNTTPSLILASTALGGGYMIYDLATPVIALDSYGWDDWSIFNPRTLEEKSHTTLTSNIITGISKAGADYVLSDKEDIAAFNIKQNVPKEEFTQIIQTTDAVINFSTSSGAIGYVITNEKYIDMYFTSDATIELSNISYENVLYEGYVDMNGKFTESSKTDITNQTLNLKGGIMYRLNVESIESELRSTTVKNIGE